MHTPDGTMPEHTPDSRTDATTMGRTSTEDPRPSRDERRPFSRRIDCADEPKRGTFVAGEHATHGRGVRRG